MATFLFEVQQENRLNQKGLLKRFTIDCYGKQPTLEEIRLEKSHKYEELKNKKGSKEYNMWFLNYNPGMEKKNEQNKTRKIYNKPKATTTKQTPKIQKMKRNKNVKNVKKEKSTSSVFHKREPQLSAFYK
jgi:predicted ATPase